MNNIRTQYQPYLLHPNNINYKSDNYLSADLAIEQQKAFQLLDSYIKQSHDKPYNWFKKQLNIQSSENLEAMLSPEQMDAIALSIFNLQNQNPNQSNNTPEFIIGDTMGNGKGRILASIARYALLNNKKVIFFTLATNLFTAFWNDLTEVNATQFIKNNKVFILHPKAKIFNRDGELIQKSLGSNILNQMYINKDFFYFDKKNNKHDVFSNIIFTTYSQFNAEERIENKIQLLSNFIDKDTIILFDEFHKSIGDSNTKKAKDLLLSYGASVIRSSATFMSQHKHINSYLNFFKLNENRDMLAINAFKESEDLQLNNQMVKLLTKKGLLIRRENKDVVKMVYNEIDYEDKAILNQWLKQLKDIFFKMFDCYQCVKNEMLVEFIKPKWLEFGSLIIRLTKILMMFGKEKFLIKRVEQALADDLKVIIILESTFESNLKQAIEYQEMIMKNNIKSNNELKSNQYYDLNFSSLLHYNLINLFSEALNEENDLFLTKFNEATELINQFPDIPLSFIDNIKQHFEQRNENVLEISGRNISVNTSINENNKKIYTITPLKKEEKALIEYKFNNGVIDDKGNKHDYNICLLTLSGSTGLSLHASRIFKDQRRRKLFEAQITDKEMERLQFLGRPNRRNQSSIPLFEGPSSGTLFEQRLIALNDKKAQKMGAFTGDYEYSENNYYTDTLNHAIYQYLIKNKYLARSLGIYTNDKKEHKYFYLDMILKRSILLTETQQNEIFSIIENAVNFENKIEQSITQLKQNFVENIKFSNLNIAWKYPYSKEDEIQTFEQEIKKVSKFDYFDTDLPIIFSTKGQSDVNIGFNKIEQLKHNLQNNIHNFQLHEYKQGLKGIQNTISKLLYSNVNLTNKNINLLMNLNIGSQISFSFNENIFHGYIQNIEFVKNSVYPSHYLYEIVLINPLNNKTLENRIITDKIYLNAYHFLNNPLIVSQKSIDWNLYIKNNETVTQYGNYLIGNLFYLNLLNAAYQFGEVVTLSKVMPNDYFPTFIYAIRLPNNKTIEQATTLLENEPLITNILQSYKLIKNGYKICNRDNTIVIKKDSMGHFTNSVGFIMEIDKQIAFDEDGDNIVHKLFIPNILKILGKITKPISKYETLYENKVCFYIKDLKTLEKILNYLFFMHKDKNSGAITYWFGKK